MFPGVFRSIPPVSPARWTPESNDQNTSDPNDSSPFDLPDESIATPPGVRIVQTCTLGRLIQGVSRGS